MKEWHISHMERMILKYVTGLSSSASAWEKRQNKRYGNLTNVCRQIDYDIRHGATREQALSFLEKISHDSSFSDLRKNADSLGRVGEIKEHFVSFKRIS